MIPSVQRYYDSIPEARAVIAHAQHFDLRAAYNLVIEMAEAYQGTDKPLFEGGHLPADECFIQMSDDIGLYARAEGNGLLCGLDVEPIFEAVAREVESKRGEIKRLYQLAPDAMKLRFKDLWDRIDDPSEPSRLEACVPLAPARSAGTMVQFVSAACEFMAMQEIAEVREASCPRPLRRRAERNGHKVELKEVVIRRTAGTASRSTGDGPRRAFHYCRGHWRLGSTWVRGHWKGDPDVGVIFHHYIAGKSGMIDAVKARGVDLTAHMGALA